MPKWKLIVAAGLLLATIAPAQELSVPDNPRYVFQRVGEDVGLSTLTVTSLAQDTKGFMWIGTQSGLVRYDGRRARRYGAEDGLASTIIDQVVIGPNNRIIAATRKGVSICHQDEFQRLPMPPGASIDPAYQFVAADSVGNIYLATRLGIFRYGPDDMFKYVKVPIGEGKENQAIEAITVSKDDTLWFASEGRIGMMRPGKRAHWLTVPSELPAEPVLALIHDSKETLWIRTAKHLARYNSAARGIEMESAQIPSANDFGIPTLDRRGNLLVPTVAGIYRRIGDRWEAVDRTRGMPVNATYSVTEDQEGAYWVGLAGAGAVRWQGTTAWEAWTQAEGLPDNIIWAVTRDAKKRLWVGTNNGVAMWDDGQHRWRVWNASSGLNGSVIRDITTASDGAIWVQAYPGGLTRFDADTLIPQRIATPKPEPSTLLRGLDGRIWIGSKDYLKVLSSNRAPFEFIDVPVSAEAKGTTAHVQVRKGVAWCGGPGGLARYDGKNWTVFTTKDGIRPEIITELTAVSPDEVWFHYDEASGLGRLRIINGKAQVRHYKTEDGLAANETYMLGTDRKGNVWAGGPLGLTMLPPEGPLRHFTRSDGLIWDDLDAGAFYEEEDGAILFGTSGGLARYSTKEAQDKTLFKPTVAITSALLGGKEHHRDSATTVPYKENTLQVQFAALTFRDTERVRCFYRLDGLESEVNETSLREARYPALPAGDYKFEVYCKSATGVVSVPTTFAFTIAPPWWQRWESRAFGIALILLAIAGVIKIRTSKLERERVQLELAVAERNQELAHANKELQEASLTDPLTGVRNRRFFDLIIGPDVNQAMRSYSPPSAVGRNRDIVIYLIDVDHFKEVNDDYGHIAGDHLLIELTRRISSVMRQSDVLIRWGGEEFLLISRSAERAKAMQLAGRVLQAVGGEAYELPGVRGLVPRTCSVGWAPFPWFAEKPEAVSYDTILKMADRALYRAKDGGRNRAFGIVPTGTAGEGSIVNSDALEFEWARLEGPLVPVESKK